MSSPNWM